ncbi:MAG: YfbK domain-containing protein, partial [Bacteroidota bacterium]
KRYACTRAGELGAGHSVTAIYEIIPVGIESKFLRKVDGLKYQKTETTSAAASDELLTVKLRYKAPDANKSQLIVNTLNDANHSWESASENFRFSAAAVSFAMLLRDSKFKGKATYKQVLELAQSAKGTDEEGYRTEFIKLVKDAKALSR